MTLKHPKGPPKQGQDESPAPEHDPVIEARVERAIAPYKELLSAEDLEFMKDTLRLHLASNPEVAPLVDRLRQRVVASSGERPSPGSDTDPTAEEFPAQRAKPGPR